MVAASFGPRPTYSVFGVWNYEWLERREQECAEAAARRVGNGVAGVLAEAREEGPGEIFDGVARVAAAAGQDRRPVRAAQRAQCIARVARFSARARPCSSVSYRTGS